MKIVLYIFLHNNYSSGNKRIGGAGDPRQGAHKKNWCGALQKFYVDGLVCVLVTFLVIWS